MKKLLYVTAFMLCAANAMAETIIVIDDNGYVKQQMTTTTSTVVQTAPVQQVVTTSNPVTVVRQSPTVTQSYYYDNYSTGSAILAGVTTAVVGALLFDGFKVHHSHKAAPAPVHISSPHHTKPSVGHSAPGGHGGHKHK